MFASLRSCAGLHRLLLGSEATIVFVGVSCGEPGGDEQMAHSQIVVVIAFSLFLLKWMLLLCFIGVLRWFASFVCFLASCVGLNRLLLGSEVNVVFV